MKFRFDKIQAPLLDPNNREKVVGLLENDEVVVVTVERHLYGWEVRLRITVDGICWHDSEVEKEEIAQVNKLRETALANKSIMDEVKRQKAYSAAKVLLDTKP